MIYIEKTWSVATFSLEGGVPVAEGSWVSSARLESANRRLSGELSKRGLVAAVQPGYRDTAGSSSGNNINEYSNEVL